ncbi:hypothetical protein OBCHQ24_01290 [Oceanobacillus iheyensis]|nr:hypothetical protein OBCHQ24_01290 [Oceanobacillus iheyensis]
MKKALQFIYLIIGIGITLSVLYGFYLLIMKSFEVFNSLQTEVAAAIVAAMATIIVSVLSVTIGKYLERKRVIENELREKKIPMYEEFVEFYFDLLMAKKINGKEMTQKEMMKFFNRFTQKLMVWGSDEVVKLWSNYRREFALKDRDSMENMFEFEKLLLAIRKDTGHKNKHIEKADLLGLFVNDINKYK